MIQSAAAVIDTDALQRAPDTAKIALGLAWRELHNPDNPQRLRDEWSVRAPDYRLSIDRHPVGLADVT